MLPEASGEGQAGPGSPSQPAPGCGCPAQHSVEAVCEEGMGHGCGAHEDVTASEAGGGELEGGREEGGQREKGARRGQMRDRLVGLHRRARWCGRGVSSRAHERKGGGEQVDSPPDLTSPHLNSRGKPGADREGGEAMVCAVLSREKDKEQPSGRWRRTHPSCGCQRCQGDRAQTAAPGKGDASRWLGESEPTAWGHPLLTGPTGCTSPPREASGASTTDHPVSLSKF